VHQRGRAAGVMAGLAQAALGIWLALRAASLSGRNQGGGTGPAPGPHGIGRIGRGRNGAAAATTRARPAGGLRLRGMTHRRGSG
jgi:hypothetical protein